MSLEFNIPKITLLHASPLWIAEVAGRTAYDSFSKSEHGSIRFFSKVGWLTEYPDIEESSLLTSLAWVHHHHSVIELIDLTFSIEGTSRAVLQEHARHRIQSLTVRSTRYTMSNVLNAYLASSQCTSVQLAKSTFFELLKTLDMFSIKDEQIIKIETDSMYDKLTRLHMQYGNDSILSKQALEVFETLKERGSQHIFNALNKCKTKRNVGDKYKIIVSDIWKVDMICKFNLRSLKNYLTLRDSGAAYQEIQILAQQMKKVIPKKYLDLIVRNKELP